MGGGNGLGGDKAGLRVCRRLMGFTYDVHGLCMGGESDRRASMDGWHLSGSSHRAYVCILTVGICT